MEFEAIKAGIISNPKMATAVLSVIGAISFANMVASSVASNEVRKANKDGNLKSAMTVTTSSAVLSAVTTVGVLGVGVYLWRKKIISRISGGSSSGSGKNAGFVFHF